MTDSHTNHTALLIIDMQKAYFHNDALKERQDELTYNTNAMISLAHVQSMPVFNIRTEHQKDIATWTLNMMNDHQGYLFTDEDDSQNVPHLNIKNTIEVIKTRDSAFHGTMLSTMLKNHSIDTVILCGVSTHTCIFQAASDAYAANINVIIAGEATASHQPKYHKTALDVLGLEYRQAVMTNASLKKYIQNNRK